MCDKRDRAITWVFCRELHILLMCSGLLQKHLFDRKWGLAENFFKQIIGHACHARFAVFFPYYCVSTLVSNKRICARRLYYRRVVSLRSSSPFRLASKLRRYRKNLLTTELSKPRIRTTHTLLGTYWKKKVLVFLFVFVHLLIHQPMAWPVPHACAQPSLRHGFARSMTRRLCHADEP